MQDEVTDGGLRIELVQGRDTGPPTVVGHGVVPVRECVKTLREAGYDGWLSLEFEGMEDNLPALRAGLSYLRSVTE